MWIIDFGVNQPNAEAADASKYEAPFARLESTVLPKRAINKRQSYRDRWWIHVEPRPAMRKALSSLERFPVTTTI